LGILAFRRALALADAIVLRQSWLGKPVIRGMLVNFDLLFRWFVGLGIDDEV
jgi:hypothetical protein